MKSKGQKTLSPIHLISLVDPKAKWLKAWLHGNLGRQLFFHLAGTIHDNLFFKTAYKTKQMNVNANTNLMHVILFLSRLNSMTNLIFVSSSERRFSLLFYLIGP